VDTDPEAMGKFSRGAVLLTSCLFAAITGKIWKVLSPGSVLKNRQSLKSLILVRQGNICKFVYEGFQFSLPIDACVNEGSPFLFTVTFEL
jgi:hypothetical protein